MIAVWDGGTRQIVRWVTLEQLPASQQRDWQAEVARAESWPYPLWIKVDVNGRDVIRTGLESGGGDLCEKYRRAAGDGLNAQSRAKFAALCSSAQGITPPPPPSPPMPVQFQPITTSPGSSCGVCRMTSAAAPALVASASAALPGQTARAATVAPQKRPLSLWWLLLAVAIGVAIGK